MPTAQKTEFWLSGPIEGITAVLQPVVHAILQARREVNEALENFPGTLIWQRPGGVASVAFHLQHLAGVLDRLFTYARGEQLSALQLEALQKEGKEDKDVHLQNLLQQFNDQVERAIKQLKNTKEVSILEPRYVGRKQVPSTILGLLFHAAEHTQRHTGQLLVTARVVNGTEKL
ncbi:MAG: DinB family protein [Chitinophagaceae bacterium]